MIRAVIFDMDGLMLDTERTSGEFQRQASEERGIPYQDLKPLIMGRAAQEVRRIHLEHYGPDYPFEEIRARARELWDQYLLDHPVPVKPGRNLAVIIEVAAMNNRNKRMGYNAAQVFTDQINRHFDEVMAGREND